MSRLSSPTAIRSPPGFQAREATESMPAASSWRMAPSSVQIFTLPEFRWPVAILLLSGAQATALIGDQFRQANVLILRPVPVSQI